MDDVTQMYNRGYQEGSVSPRALDAWQYLGSKFVDHFPNMESWCDVGCGGGGLLLALEIKGRKVWGIEGSTDAVGILPSQADKIAVWDLRLPLQIISRVDVVTCFDVAEHVGAAQTLVESLTRLSRCWILFGAATPDQPGHGHIDLRPPEQWVQFFGERGWIFCPAYTEELKRDLDTERERHDFLWWVHKNLMVFTLASPRSPTHRD